MANQFRQYVYDVSDLIASPKAGDNNLTVAFESAYLYGLEVMAERYYEDPLTPDVGARDFERFVQFLTSI